MADSLNDYLQFGNVITFEVYPASIIGTRFQDVKVLGLLDKDTANLWIDADAMHLNVFPTLPNGVPNNPDDYQYVKLKHLNGAVSVIGIPWIRTDSVVVSTRGTLTLSVKNVTPVDMDRIVRAINANGYAVDTVSLR
jgi:hypothetical protein